ncbi:xylose isomerase [Mongoliimonas terrestris]|uniref:xylose isomerase n=1 Tax=Mongoliimonas terrestris TaxID=1709001 RepID=UPI000949676E|nr:xylose isomerase [Mongoliimonas terrestris]
MATIGFYQSLWATEDRHPGRPERPVGERFDQVKADGWKGMAIDLGALSLEEARACIPHYERTGLAGLLTAFPRTIEELRPALALGRAIGAPFVIVVGQVMPLRLADMIPVAMRWLEMADREGMPIQFETHRNCLTNDLYTTLQLIEHIPEMRLSADLSHYVVDREMMQPITPDYEAMVRTILERSGSFQGRVATRNQVQVPLHFPQHRIWVETFLRWWRHGLSAWKARAEDGDEVIFLSELGPREYAITDADGNELSDRRREALDLRAMVEEIWLNLDAPAASL